MSIFFVVPITIKAEANQSWHEHPMAKARRKKKQQEAILAHLLMNREHLPPFPVSVKFTYYGKRRLDGDNLIGGLKAARDEVARFYKVDDGDPRWRWPDPEQITSRRGEYALGIEITHIPAASNVVTCFDKEIAKGAI
jgi:hypothetical protein